MATAYTYASSNKLKSWLWLVAFVVFIVLLGYVFAKAFNLQWLLPLAVTIAIVQSISSYWWSDKIVLSISRAKEIDKKTNQQLYRLVENLSITAGLPMPRLYIITDTAPNAFATGRDPNHAVICVTQGLLDKLDKQELEGVLAHEFSHIGNYDIRLQTIIVVLVGLVALLSDWFIYLNFFSDDDNGGNSVFALIGIVLAILSPLIAGLIQMAISRKREFLADASGALLTRNPDGLARALEDISKDKEPLEVANKATAHMYITNPLKDHKESRRNKFSSLFDTHPAVEERIDALRNMAL
ncbi:MAG: M48 family metallopeptidase [Patescibacteria group bacterium]|jgi:heat shock protein HtpX|nr:M48 family metallopeptidase [Patescibacteria group bacterium]